MFLKSAFHNLSRNTIPTVKTVHGTAPKLFRTKFFDLVSSSWPETELSQDSQHLYESRTQTTSPLGENRKLRQLLLLPKCQGEGKTVLNYWPSPLAPFWEILPIRAVRTSSLEPSIINKQWIERVCIWASIFSLAEDVKTIVHSGFKASDDSVAMAPYREVNKKESNLAPQTG